MDPAAANLTPVSRLHNLSLSQIADELGQVKAKAADLANREATLKAELIARGATEAEGELFRAVVSESARWTLDASRIREELGELWCVAHSKVSTVTTLRVTARTGSRQAA